MGRGLRFLAPGCVYGPVAGQQCRAFRQSCGTYVSGFEVSVIRYMVGKVLGGDLFFVSWGVGGGMGFTVAFKSEWCSHSCCAFVRMCICGFM